MEDKEQKIAERDSQYDHYIGRRVAHGNELGTIRYLGVLQHEDPKVKDKTELWVGIEWDSMEKGKHNGTVKGI